MEILNETVYDSQDIGRFIRWVNDVTHPIQVEVERERHQEHVKYMQKHGHTIRAFAPSSKHELPEKIRVGYYNQSKREDDEVRWTSESNRRKGIPRLGIVRHTKLPLVAMEVIAREAADKDQRTLPTEVMLCLFHRVRHLLNYYVGLPEDEVAKALTQAPTVRYAFKANRASAKAAKAQAAKESLARAEQKVGWLEREVAGIEENLREANTKLFKARARLRKLRGGTQRMEVTHVQ